LLAMLQGIAVSAGASGHTFAVISDTMDRIEP
jgi:hypothetical protein